MDFLKAFLVGGLICAPGISGNKDIALQRRLFPKLLCKGYILLV